MRKVSGDVRGFVRERVAVRATTAESDKQTNDGCEPSARTSSSNTRV
eukprot:COSAG02_NODE_44892_length_362_cov_0.688213_1_plen_46_part_01